MPKLTKDQSKALLKLWQRGETCKATYKTFLNFRRSVKVYRDYALVGWAGMFVGIEKDGHTHT